MLRILRPDGFALLLMLTGLSLLLVPMMVMPGLLSVLAAVAYWLTMVIVRAVSGARWKRRDPEPD